MSNPATECTTASHGVRNLSFHGPITYSLLPKYTEHTHTSTHANSPPKLSNSLHVQHILHYPPHSPPPPPLFNILAQYRRVALGLHVQVGPLDCSLGLLGREEVEEKKKKKQKKDEMMEGRSTITVCFLTCWGLQPNLLHLLWRLTLAGERYIYTAGEGV